MQNGLLRQEMSKAMPVLSRKFFFEINALNGSRITVCRANAAKKLRILFKEIGAEN